MRYLAPFYLAIFSLWLSGFSAVYATTYVGQTAGQFRVDESGAANYSIPLTLPAGIAGVKLELSFSYNSNGGDGYMGRGWTFSGASAITRCPKNMAQDDEQGNISNSSNDRLCLNGQRLVTKGRFSDKATSNASYWSAESYHSEIDNFSIITPHGYNQRGQIKGVRVN